MPAPRTPPSCSICGPRPPAGGANSPRAQNDAEQALANLAAASDERLLVAESDGRIVAAMKLSRGPMSPLVLESVVHTSFLLVLPEFRRHGFGRALMEAAVGWAEEKDISELTVLTDGNRETNRFFARLGLTTLGTVRHSSVQGVRKKLSVEGRHRGGGTTGTWSRCSPSGGPPAGGRALPELLSVATR